jgi:clorobiocin biosynthesis protein CloN4
MLMHFAGHMAEAGPYRRFAERHGLLLIEDAAHAVGVGGVGGYGVGAAFSFYGNKNMTTGEGGMVLMRDGGLLDRPRPPALRACVVAGEPFPLPQAQELRKHWQGVRMFNWYGPTETNVCTSYEVTDADLARVRPLPIGTAASGDTVLLDPPGEGEIVVDGPTVMLGYWGGPAHSGPYRTGDLGRVGEDGGLEYVSRLDHMVKVRGQRIELGEIEAVLGGHESVASVAVLVRGSGLESMLHAVIVPAPGHRPSLLGIKVFAAARLPTYMVPDVLHLTAGLPLTPNGKTDRTALAAAIERGEI